tara:strand:- start:2091 stop:2270 length:180 start_codon:yes stop_codon:yes gene_type:complete
MLVWTANATLLSSFIPFRRFITSRNRNLGHQIVLALFFGTFWQTGWKFANDEAASTLGR